MYHMCFVVSRTTHSCQVSIGSSLEAVTESRVYASSLYSLDFRSDSQPRLHRAVVSQDDPSTLQPEPKLAAHPLAKPPHVGGSTERNDSARSWKTVRYEIPQDWRPATSFISDVYLCKNFSGNIEIRHTHNIRSLYFLVDFHFAHAISVLLFCVAARYCRNRARAAFYPFPSVTFDSSFSILGSDTARPNYDACVILLGSGSICT